MPGAAGAVPTEGNLQGQRGYHHRQYGFPAVPGRDGADHAEGPESGAGKGNHRHLQHRREPREGAVPLAQLSKAWPRSFIRG